MSFLVCCLEKLFEDLVSIFKKAYIIDLPQVKLNFFTTSTNNEKRWTLRKSTPTNFVLLFTVLIKW